MVDHYTKLAEAVPCGDDNAEQTCDLHLTPAYIQSDNGPQFAARLTQLFVQAGYIIQVFSTPEHPRTNGLVERQNRTLLNMLKVYQSSYVFEWDQHLEEVVGIYNSTVHATTGVTPYKLLTGREKPTPLGYFFPEFLPKKFRSDQDYIDRTLKRQQELHELVRHNTQQAQRRQKKYFDQRLKGPVAYEVGDLVWVVSKAVPTRATKKVVRGWRGPLKISEVRQKGRYYVLENGQKAHFEKLKLHWNSPTDWIVLDDSEVHFILDDETGSEEETVALSEGANPYAEEELSLIHISEPTRRS